MVCPAHATLSPPPLPCLLAAAQGAAWGRSGRGDVARRSAWTPASHRAWPPGANCATQRVDASQSPHDAVWLQASHRRVSRGAAVLVLVSFLAAWGSDPWAAAADDDEDPDEGSALLRSACGTGCMDKCFTNFGAALVPGNRADVEVYCKSRCVYMCDVTEEDVAAGAATGPVQPADPLNALSGKKRSGRFCSEGKAATSAVAKGVYAERGLEFYGCN